MRLRRQFRPEFLNRIDEIIVFRSLSEEDIERIVDIQIRQLKKRLADKHLDIELTEAAKAALAKEGFDPTYGARPLKRAIQREIQDKLAMALLEGRFKEGDKIIVDADSEGKLTFEHADAVRASRAQCGEQFGGNSLRVSLRLPAGAPRPCTRAGASRPQAPDSLCASPPFAQASGGTPKAGGDSGKQGP